MSPEQNLAEKVTNRATALGQITIGNTPVGEGIYAVIPTDGGERMPLIAENISVLAQQSKVEGLDLHIVVADWGLSLRDAQGIRQICDASKLSVQFVPVDRRFKSAGHSFNAGVNAIIDQEQANGLSGYPIMKADDDSVATEGALKKLYSVIQGGAYQIVTPRNARPQTMEQILNPQLLAAFRDRFDTQDQDAQIIEMFPDILFSDGKFDLASLMASWQFKNRFISTENHMLMTFDIAAKFHQAGGVFVPERTTGEGIEFLLQAKKQGFRLAFIKNLWIVDRPDTGVDQNIAYGIDDALFARALEQSGVTSHDLRVITEIADGRIATISVPPESVGGYHGILIFPDQSKQALEILQANNVSWEDIGDTTSRMVERFNERSYIGNLKSIPTAQSLQERLLKSYSIANRLLQHVEEILVRNSNVSGDIYDRTSGIHIRFPFNENPEFLISTLDQACGSLHHTAGCLAGGIDDPNFLMIQH